MRSLLLRAHSKNGVLILEMALFSSLQKNLAPDKVISDVSVRDIRFPTSLETHGSDAVHTDPDYSAAYVVVTVRGLETRGHGHTFTLGRGTEVVVCAIRSLLPLLLGRSLLEILTNFGEFWRTLTNESQLRWLGPEKGVTHLAVAGVANALWDLWGKIEGKPVWKLLSDMTPEETVTLIDFRHITDALTRDEALQILRDKYPTRGSREEEAKEKGYPLYTTSVGWLGYSDEQIRELCREALGKGFTQFKMKVGQNVEDDARRAGIIRREIGWDFPLMMDANQRWEVGEAIENMTQLAEFKPLWIEEPTNPDDVLGHARIRKELKRFGIGVATGEAAHNRVMFKQFFQAEAMDFCQIDSCRLGGVNEIISVLLMAAKFQVPVCPHAGGVGLCEYVQHLAFYDFICVSGTREGRVVEYVDHLHEHFLHPVRVRGGSYLLPAQPGYSSEMWAESLDQYEYPSGAVWLKLAQNQKS